MKVDDKAHEDTAMTCFGCDHDSLMLDRIKMGGERNGQKFEIETDGYRCSNCGFQTIDSQQSEEFTRQLSDAYRRANGLLTSEEIRARRNELGMTQQEFAAYIGPGVASVRRWELGQIQDKAMDLLIRLKTDPEEARKNLQAVSAQVPERCVVAMAPGYELTFFSQKPATKKSTMKMNGIEFRADVGNSRSQLAA